MNLTCYNSSDPAALNATVLYSEHHDSQNLWDRNTSLPLCPALYVFISQCVVCCVVQVVFAVCKNLMDDESIVMEGQGVPMSLTRSDCPRADSVGSPNTTESPDPSRSQLGIFIPVSGVIIIIIIIIIAVVVYYCRGKISRFIRKFRGMNPVPPDEPVDATVALSPDLNYNGGELSSISTSFTTQEKTPFSPTRW